MNEINLSKFNVIHFSTRAKRFFLESFLLFFIALVTHTLLSCWKLHPPVIGTQLLDLLNQDYLRLLYCPRKPRIKPHL